MKRRDSNKDLRAVKDDTVKRLQDLADNRIDEIVKSVRPPSMVDEDEKE